MAWFEEHLSGDVSLKTRDDLALIAIQGPKAVELTIKAIADYSFDISGLDKLPEQAIQAKTVSRLLCR